MTDTLTAGRRPVCDLPPDPTEVMRELQAIAQSHPELADAMKRASDMIGKETATIIDICRTLIGSRLTEHFG